MPSMEKVGMCRKSDLEKYFVKGDFEKKNRLHNTSGSLDELLTVLSGVSQTYLSWRLTDPGVIHCLVSTTSAFFSTIPYRLLATR